MKGLCLEQILALSCFEFVFCILNNTEKKFLVFSLFLYFKPQQNRWVFIQTTSSDADSRVTCPTKKQTKNIQLSCNSSLLHIFIPFSVFCNCYKIYGKWHLYFVYCVSFLFFVFCISYVVFCILYFVFCILYFVFCILYVLFCILYFIVAYSHQWLDGGLKCILIRPSTAPIKNIATYFWYFVFCTLYFVFWSAPQHFP